MGLLGKGHRRNASTSEANPPVRRSLDERMCPSPELSPTCWRFYKIAQQRHAAATDRCTTASLQRQECGLLVNERAGISCSFCSQQGGASPYHLESSFHEAKRCEHDADQPQQTRATTLMHQLKHRATRSRTTTRFTCSVRLCRNQNQENASELANAESDTATNRKDAGSRLMITDVIAARHRGARRSDVDFIRKLRLDGCTQQNTRPATMP